MPDFAKSIAKALNLRPEQVAAAIELLDEGATIPFIARYRKERTGTLDEEQLRQVQALLEKGRALEERRAAVIASVEEQGKMTPELLEKFQAADNMWLLDTILAIPNFLLGLLMLTGLFFIFLPYLKAEAWPQVSTSLIGAVVLVFLLLIPMALIGIVMGMKPNSV